MLDFIKSVSEINVSLRTVLIGLAVIYLFFIIVRKFISGIFRVFKSLTIIFPSITVLASLMFICGLTSIGYGIGELNSGDAVFTPLSNDNIIKIATDRDTKGEVVKELFDYAKFRDEKVSSAKIPSITDKPLHHLGWSSIFGGLGMAVIGFLVLAKKYG